VKRLLGESLWVKRPETGLTRYLKQTLPSGLAASNVKKYYLRDVMQFLIPYTSSRKPSGNMTQTSSPRTAEYERETVR
jgi:hypothetical protein